MNTGSEDSCGGSRSTNRSDAVAPDSSVHVASNRIVSLDMPLVPGTLKSVIVAFCTLVFNHAVSCSRTTSWSRVDVFGRSSVMPLPLVRCVRERYLTARQQRETPGPMRPDGCRD